MKALVTGGAGFLGSHLTDALVDRGDQVTILDNLHRGSLANLERHGRGERVTVLTDDIRDYAAVLRAADGADLVFHLAAQSNVMGAMDDPDYSFTTNVAGTFNVLKASAHAGVGRVVFASSREVYGEPESIPVPESAVPEPKGLYGASKLASEAYCRAWGRSGQVECQILRLANVYGPRDRDRVIPLWLERATAGEPLLIYGGEQILDFISVGRCVDALLAAAERPVRGPINVGSGIGTRLPDLADRIVQLTGSRSSIETLSAREAEVVRYVADVSLMRDALQVDPGDEPLDSLPAML